MTSMGGVDLSPMGTARLLSFTKDMAIRAGAMIREAFKEPKTDYERKSVTDPVTETDKAVEAYIRKRIMEEYPGHRFIGEESAAGNEWTDLPTWIIDPIDGTANFIHRIPFCAISIALTVHKQYIIGVIYNPLQEELFEATYATPSKLNGAGIHVSRVSTLESACVATECGSDRGVNKTGIIMDQLQRVLRHNAQCVRMMGSCALNMCNVACGRVDILYEQGPFPWDMAAGVLIVRQAGGVVNAGFGGETFRLLGRSVLAYTPTLADALACFDEKMGNTISS